MVRSRKLIVPQSTLEAGFHPREHGTNCATGNNNKQNHNVMLKKSFYETPEAELLLVKFEENFCYSPNPNGTEGSVVKDPFDGWDEGEGN